MTDDTRQMLISHMDSGFRAVNLRIDDKHEAVMDRLDSVVERQDDFADTMGKHAQSVAVQEGRVSAIGVELGQARDRWHERFSALQKHMGMKPEGDAANVTRLDLKTAIAIYVGGIASLYAVLHYVTGKV